MSASLVLLDDSASPKLRGVIGGLMERSDRADFAVTRIRLAAMDLTDREVALPRCRVLLGTLDASMLHDDSADARGPALGRLLGWVRSGRLEVRSAGIGAWTPDFSVFEGRDLLTALVGAHYFGNPYPTVGPSLTCVVADPGAVRRAADRFDALWRRSHDVLPAIRDVLERAR